MSNSLDNLPDKLFECFAEAIVVEEGRALLHIKQGRQVGKMYLVWTSEFMSNFLLHKYTSKECANLRIMQSLTSYKSHEWLRNY